VNLTFESFHLRLQLAERAPSTNPYDNWCRLVVTVEVPGFEGKFDWSATLGDLRELDEVLRGLYENPGKEERIVYDPLEPSVSFVFRPQLTGQIEADYRLRAHLAWGPELRGTFTFDQSYIPSIRDELAMLLRSATAV
jgi:hypothetical protein